MAKAKKSKNKIRKFSPENNLIVKYEEAYPNTQIFGENNKAFLCGSLDEDLTFSHEIYHRKFYSSKIWVPRPSGAFDVIPLVIPELASPLQTEYVKGKWIVVGGEFRTTHREAISSEKSHMTMYFFVKLIKFYDTKNHSDEFNVGNLIYLNCYLYKKPNYRLTPKGSTITDLKVAVNRRRSTDHLPCVAWDENAEFANRLKIGDHVEIYGRIQSRKYFKKFSPDSFNGEWKTTYEISIIEIKKVD